VLEVLSGVFATLSKFLGRS